MAWTDFMMPLACGIALGVCPTLEALAGSAGGTTIVTTSGATVGPPQQFAQLGKWLHGDPPPHVKAAAPKQLALVTTAAGVAVDAQVESFLRELAAGLKAREGKPLLARLSPQYSVDDLPSGTKPSDVFLQAIDRLPGPETITVQSIVSVDGQRVAKVEFRFSNERLDLKSLHFDAAGRLLRSDLFRVQRVGGHG